MSKYLFIVSGDIRRWLYILFIYLCVNIRKVALYKLESLDVEALMLSATGPCSNIILQWNLPIIVSP